MEGQGTLLRPAVGPQPAFRPAPPRPTPQVEATSARNGLGLVKLMGRQSGFIAMQVGFNG
jgi:hypothetical protein